MNTPFNAIQRQSRLLNHPFDILLRVQGTPVQVYKAVEARGMSLERPLSYDKKNRRCDGWLFRGSMVALLRWHNEDYPRWVEGGRNNFTGMLIDYHITTKRQ